MWVSHQPQQAARNSRVSLLRPEGWDHFFFASEVDLRYQEVNHVDLRAAVSGGNNKKILWAMASTSKNTQKKLVANEIMVDSKGSMLVNILYPLVN